MNPAARVLLHRSSASDTRSPSREARPLPREEIVMTRLRQRMLEDMQLRGLSARMQGCYVQAVRQLADHYHRSPDQITEDDLRQYVLSLANEKRVARATATIALCGIRFFFEHTL